MKYMEMRDQKCVKLAEPLVQHDAELTVIKAVAFNQEMSALNSLSGSLVLAGVGETDLQWGIMICE